MQTPQHLYEFEMSRLAAEYYALARVAVNNKLLGVFGNLYHHAFEMLLKSAISRFVAKPELTKCRHDVPKLWAAFRTHYPISDSKYDNAARVLHAFEELRYPEKFLDHVMELSVIEMGSSATEIAFGVKRGPRLIVNVDHLEDWWLDIHAACKLNPLFFHRGWPAYLKSLYLSEAAASRLLPL